MPRPILFAALFLFACSRVSSAFQATAPCMNRLPEDRPYNREHLLDVVKSQTPRRAEYLIRTCGVRAPFNNELETALQDAGASPNVISAVREVAPRPAVVSKPKPPPEPSSGDVRENPKDGLKCVFIPAGTFRMGCSPGDNQCSSNEKPAHDVRISNEFWMGQTDVTVEAYKRFASATARSMPTPSGTNPNWTDGSVPMTMASWEDAHAYCEWAGMRLPTEAEWEYAARSGSTGARYGALDAIAWYSDNSNGRPHGAGEKQPNAFKLYDMLGNVWQWTADWYKDSYYSETVNVDPQGPTGGDHRVLRGGSWFNYSSLVRASDRSGFQPSFRFYSDGFRCAGEIRVP